MHEHFDIAVVGGGLAGSVAALAAAAEGWRVAFIAPQPPRQDGRTTALLSESVDYLGTLGLWDEVKPKSAPLRTMRILDGTTRLLRSRPVSFRSSDIGLEAFGYNIPNQPLFDALQAATAASPLITRFESPLESATQTDSAIELVLADGARLSAFAAMAADGRNSKLRTEMGIKVRTWSYPQTALVLNFRHSLPHGDTSTEFHTEEGPFTTVPLPGNRSSLVWAVRPDRVDSILSMPRDMLNREVETRMSSILGKVEIDTDVQAWPLSSLIASRFGAGRVMLVGETGHGFPPIGAQGLNLGLRDIMEAIEVLKDAGGPQQAPRAVSAFNRKRLPDIASRTASVDLLNRALMSSFLPVQVLRVGGLAALSSIPPLRNIIMREGMTPGWRRDLFRWRRETPASGEQVGR
ncbi:UbiH/UbiF family hydroxylase [Hoeflea olei]|uniref:2-octaprenyl-6-methoxyphenyl hydroxylase n=1 Tax=Hoeflea olei TaxID=1480615 RepID=A0A1C1YSV2_9HYPH|nr:UbiH/UbiF family hydroxylase [Hoeflea olei]OCW56526.1 2-octaprenyl-6-methoxyphenyl hydroxylase [Hoeflea olei]